MNTNTLLLVAGAGLAAYYFLGRRRVVTGNPTVGGTTSAVYIPPAQAVPVGSSGYPSPAAPGPYGWGLIPSQPSDAQQAASIIGAIGGAAQGIGSLVNGFSNAFGSSGDSGSYDDSGSYGDSTSYE